MMEWSEKEDQLKKESEKESLNNYFLKLSNDINIDQMKIFLQEDSQIKVETIDKVLRQIMSKFENKPEQNTEKVKELFSHADLNYINSNYNDSNILMDCCKKGEPILIDLLLITDKNCLKKKKSIEIDIFKVDKNNQNILHYLFNNEYEYDVIEIFEKIMNYARNNNKNKNKIELLTKEDKNGITPLVIILKKGWYNLLKEYFKYFHYKSHIIRSNKNNNIHCAIEGKNIKCLKLLLNYCSYEELNQTNSDGLTPCLYAKKNQYSYMVELIKQFQNNYNNTDVKKILLLPKNDTNEIINLYMDKNYSEVKNFLSKYKINQYITNNNYPNISFEWNSLLTKKYDLFNKGLTEEHILTKFTKNHRNNSNNLYQNKPNIIGALYEFNKFFNKYVNELAIKDHINEENYYSMDIIIYNKIIYYYKLSDYDSFLKYINLYFTHIYRQTENNFINNILINNKENDDESENDKNFKKIRINYYKYITFVNISFLLIEYSIKENNEIFGQIIMDELDKYLSNNTPTQITPKNKPNTENTDEYEGEEDILTIILNNIENKKIIIKYLNENEVLNPLNSSLDDSLCYFYLLELFFIIKFNSSKSAAIRRINTFSNMKYINYKSEEENEEKDEEDEEEEAEIEEDCNIYDDTHLDNNKNNIKILNNSQQVLKGVKTIIKNSNVLKIFAKRFKMFYYELKTYSYYLSGDINKSMSKNFSFKKNLQQSIKSNDYYSNEHKFFYYNSLGILNLKLKKYALAEHYFKLGINLFKQIHNDNNTYNSINRNDIVINKIEYLFKMKFNLGLTYFYNNNYQKSYNIFNELKNVQEFKNNIFFWYRLGLSSLNLCLISMRDIKQKSKKYYQKLNKESQLEDIADLKDEESENNSIDELYEEYEKIYGYHDMDMLIQNKENKISKIFLENNKRIDDKKIDNYLDTSISSFKRIINIYKKINNNFLNENEKKRKEDLKGIYNFYTMNIGETKEFKNMINKQNINKKNNIPKSLIYSCYLNLLFAYNLKKKYLYMILLIKNIKKERKLSNNMKRKLKYYELLSLINLNKKKDAQELINEEMNKYGNIDKDTNNDFDCFSKDDCQIEKDINHKLLLQIGQVFIDCKNKKYDEAENKLLNIIENNYNGNEDIPKYYYRLMIYILSSQNKTNKTIKLIKYRWKQIQNNNNTHTNYYKDNNG